ncbi:MAG: 5'(3')-deoxyribonucleotidase, partial [Cytophagaceae bacterium]
VYVATAAMEFPNSFREKYDWLASYFPTIHWKNIIFLGDKSILGAEYLIDDMPYNLHTFSGKGLLFDALHNRDETAFERVMNWTDVTNLLLD